MSAAAVAFPLAHPEVADLLATFPFPFDVADPAVIRAFEKTWPVQSTIDDAVTTEELELELNGRRTKMIVMSPKKGGNGSAIVYIHGGGFVFGAPGSNATLALEMVKRTGIVVVLPSYRLSPECRYPDALDDVDAVYRWTDAGAGGRGVVAGRVFIGGSSAGGNLAGALS